MDYISQNHSKHLLMIHLIFSVKYRKKLLIHYSEDIKRIFSQIMNEYDFNILQMECDEDHIHLLIETEPKISILQIVKILKSKSTIELWKEYTQDLRKHFWYKNMFWGRGYFVCSIGNASEETIRNYIENQG